MFQEELGGPMLDGTFVLHSVTLPDSGPVDCPHRDDADAWGLCRVTYGTPPNTRDGSDWIRWEHLPNYGPRTPDVNADGFSNADDYDLWMIGYTAGCPCSDFDGNGFVNGDDADLFTSEFVSGVTP